MPNIKNLATTAPPTSIENGMPNVSNLLKKSDCNTKISDSKNKIATDHYQNKYITTQEFVKLTSKNFTARLKLPNLASKSGIANFVKKVNVDNKLKHVTSNKNELNKLPKKVKLISTKRLAIDLINQFNILIGANCFFFKNISEAFSICPS